MKHADMCECKDLRRKCPDVPKIKQPEGWRWDGTGDLGVWALNCMSEGRHFMVDSSTDVWTIDTVSPNGFYVQATANSVESRQFSGDELAYSMEAL